MKENAVPEICEPERFRLDAFIITADMPVWEHRL